MTTDGGRDRWSARTVAASPRVERSDTVASTEPPAPPGVVLSVFDPPADRFTQVGELGRGGMGVVMEAHDRALDRPVAIKYTTALSSVELARFEREARITAQLQHPGVVPIFDAGRDAEGNPFYVMRKIEGDALSLRVKRAATVRDRIALVPEMLGAIDAAAYAHARGIVHRDIKPWNILLGPFGESLLIDWGIASQPGETEAAPDLSSAATQAVLTRVGFAMGTPGFMPPEQARGEPVDARADVYSLGATLYYVLSGQVPLATSSATEAIEAVARGVTPDVAAIPSDIPSELVTITMKALASDASERYATAGELAADLRRFFAGQLVAAHVYTTRARMARWVRRHRLITAVSAVAVVAIATIAILSVLRVTHERDLADASRALAEDRADRMIVQRAASFVGRDSTMAIAVLRELPGASAQWPAARTVVESAVAAGGIARAYSTPHETVMALAVSPSGVIASAGMDRTLQLHRRDGSLVRAFAQTASRLEWLDDGTLVLEDGRLDIQSVKLLDVATGAVRVIADAVKALKAGEGYLVVLDPAGAVIEVARDGTRTVLVDAGATAIDIASGRIAIASRDRLIVIEADGTRLERPLAIETAVFRVQLSDSGTRAALFAWGAMIAVTVSNGDPGPDAAPSSTWPVAKDDALNDVVYAGDSLYTWSSDGSGVQRREPGTEPVHFAVRTREIALAARYAGGAAFLAPTGEIGYADERGFVAIARGEPPLRCIAVARDGSFLVAGTPTGQVLVFDLAAIRPRVLATAPDLSIHGLVGDRAVISAVQPTTERTIEVVRSGVPPLVLGRVAIRASVLFGHGIVLATQSAGPLRAWTLDGTVVADATDAIAPDLGPGLHGGTSVFYATPTSDILEQPTTAVAPIRLGSVDGTVAGLQVLDGVLLVRSKTTQNQILFTSFDRTGRHAVPIHLDFADVRVRGRTSDGAWWAIVDAHTLYRVTADGTGAPVELKGNIQALRVVGDRVFAYAAAVLYVLDRTGKVLSTLPVDLGSASACGGLVAWRMAETLAVADPSTGATRRYPLSQVAKSVSCSAEGLAVGAVLTVGDRGVQAVLWTDPVPKDPRALPAYLATLTNARLPEGFDALSWE